MPHLFSMVKRIAIVGDWSYPCYEQAFSQGLHENGVQTLEFNCSTYLKGTKGRLQRYLPTLPIITGRLNRDILKFCITRRPDAVLFWRPVLIHPDTIKEIASKGIRTISYNNDDPFHNLTNKQLPRIQYRLWKRYIRCLPYFRHNFFYRKVNCREATELGATHSAVLYPYFVPSTDRPIQLTSSENSRFATDVVFAGHFEPDGRDTLLSAIINDGHSTKIWGGQYWSSDILASIGYKFGPVTPVFGRDYTAALCGAKVCLAFLSKLNRDTYTRRCFEIPACGRLLLAERTEDLLRLFDEDKEACFFSSKGELSDKVRWLLSNDSLRANIAAAGLRRVWRDGHDVTSRAKVFLKEIS
jgi:spore maturation protein CgeB